jgi:hypothetical protein
VSEKADLWPTYFANDLDLKSMETKESVKIKSITICHLWRKKANDMEINQVTCIPVYVFICIPTLQVVP